MGCSAEGGRSERIVAMTPGSHDFTIYQGSKLVKVFAWTVGTAPPVAVDLTGYTARMQARATVAAGSPEFDLTVGSGLTMGGALGTITVTISATVTAALTVPSMVWDLELMPAGVAADAFRFIEGKITLSPEVTR